MNNKKHKLSSARHNNFIFLGLWVISHILIFLFGYWLIFEFNQGLMYPENLVVMLINFLINFSIPVMWVLLQGILLKYQYGWSLRRWMTANLFGGLSGLIFCFLGTWLMGMSFGFSARDPRTMSAFFLFTTLAALAPVAAGQIWAIRQHIRNAWVWLLGLLIGVALIPTAQNMFNVYQWFDNFQVARMVLNIINPILAGGMFSLVTGLTIIALVALTDKESTQQNSSNNDDATRLNVARNTLTDSADSQHISEGDEGRKFAQSQS